VQPGSRRGRRKWVRYARPVPTAGCHFRIRSGTPKAHWVLRQSATTGGTIGHGAFTAHENGPAGNRSGKKQRKLSWQEPSGLHQRMTMQALVITLTNTLGFLLSKKNRSQWFLRLFITVETRYLDRLMAARRPSTLLPTYSQPCKTGSDAAWKLPKVRWKL